MSEAEPEYPPPSTHARRRTLAWIAVTLVLLAAIVWAAVRVAAPRDEAVRIRGGSGAPR